jgi:hypothetical protein
MSQLSIVDAPSFIRVTEAYILLGVLPADSNFHKRPIVDFNLEKVLGSSLHSLNNINLKLERLYCQFTYEVAHDSAEAVAFTHLDQHGVRVGQDHLVRDPLFVPVEDY